MDDIRGVPSDRNRTGDIQMEIRTGASCWLYPAVQLQSDAITNYTTKGGWPFEEQLDCPSRVCVGAGAVKSINIIFVNNAKVEMMMSGRHGRAW